MSNSGLPPALPGVYPNEIKMTASFLNLNFVGALCLVGLLRYICPQKYYVVFGVLSSALIIGLASPKSLLVICGITILFILPLQALSRLAEKSRLPKIVKNSLMPAAITGLVVLLIYYKTYLYFSVPCLDGAWLRSNIVSLIGFSYFIFRAIDYLHIQLILKPKVISVWRPLYYVLFPPTITSGPIQKYQDFQQQIENPLPISKSLILSAIYRVTRGYFRKAVVAVIINGFVEKLLAIPNPTVFHSILVILLLYLYFYYDFSGYSDIAIGFGLLLGIRVPENFREPFKATSVTEFWRHWHITLVDWFRNHVFIPLGGMRGSRLHAAGCAFLIMFLCGLWHGVTLSFILWGIWHGANLFAEAMLGVKPISPSLRSGFKYWLRVIWCNARVALGCIFFLPDSQTIIRVLNGFVTWRLW